jgi:hypothetical protein
MGAFELIKGTCWQSIVVSENKDGQRYARQLEAIVVRQPALPFGELRLATAKQATITMWKEDNILRFACRGKVPARRHFGWRRYKERAWKKNTTGPYGLRLA